MRKISVNTTIRYYFSPIPLAKPETSNLRIQFRSYAVFLHGISQC